MAFSIINQYTGVDSTSGTTLSGGVTLTTALSVGDLVIFAHGRNSTSAGNVGISSISGNGSNTWQYNVTGAVRGTGMEVAVSILPITSALSANTVMTPTWITTGNRKTAVVAHVRGLTNVVHVKSTVMSTSTLGNVDQNANGSGSFESVSTSTSASIADTVTFGIMSMTAGNTLTATGSATTIAQAQTSTGSSDRGTSLQYRVNSTTGTKSSTATQGASGIWACANIVIPITITNPLPSDVIISGAKKSVVNSYVIIGGVKKNVVSTKVIIGGVKKTVV